MIHLFYDVNIDFKMKRKLKLSACILILFLGSTSVAQTQHPSWSHQSNIYEVNLRQYSESGSFADFEKHLPRLKEMGVEILWFMPITPIGIKDRKMSPSDLGSYYAVKDYKAVNPEHGTIADFKALVAKAHKMGFKVITDWVANHSSTDNKWVAEHPNFYTRDSSGKFLSPFDWSDVYKLNYRNSRMRDSMLDAMKFWIRETDIDGFRCDVAEEVPADFWKNSITQLRKMKELFMLAEGNKPWLHEVGFDATYNWDMMGKMAELYAGKINIHQFDSSINKGIRDFGPDAFRLYFTSNHDENSWNGTEFEKYGSAAACFAVFTQTIYQSVPLIYSGQEEPNKKRLKFFVKDPIQWGKYEMASFYKTLLNLRRENKALAAGSWYDKLNSSNNNTIFAYLRANLEKRVLVLLNLSNSAQEFTIDNVHIKGKATDPFSKQKKKIKAKQKFSLPAWGYQVYAY
jgi:glycosidase